MSARTSQRIRRRQKVQQGERLFHNPAVFTTPVRAVFGAAASDQRAYLQITDQITVLVMVMAAVGENDVGTLPWTATAGIR